MDELPATTFDVQVVYATPTQQHIITLTVATGCTAQHAVSLSGITASFPDIDLPGCRLGIFGRLVNPDQPLTPGDRVEIYRPLLIDPKESRRQRAHHAKRQRAIKAS